jgi:hypothetical protein
LKAGQTGAIEVHGAWVTRSNRAPSVDASNTVALHVEITLSSVSDLAKAIGVTQASGALRTDSAPPVRGQQTDTEATATIAGTVLVIRTWASIGSQADASIIRTIVAGTSVVAKARLAVGDQTFVVKVTPSTGAVAVQVAITAIRNKTSLSILAEVARALFIVVAAIAVADGAGTVNKIGRREVAPLTRAFVIRGAGVAVRGEAGLGIGVAPSACAIRVGEAPPIGNISTTAGNRRKSANTRIKAGAACAEGRVGAVVSVGNTTNTGIKTAAAGTLRIARAVITVRNGAEAIDTDIGSAFIARVTSFSNGKQTLVIIAATTAGAFLIVGTVGPVSQRTSSGLSALSACAIGVLGAGLAITDKTFSLVTKIRSALSVLLAIGSKRQRAETIPSAPSALTSKVFPALFAVKHSAVSVHTMSTCAIVVHLTGSSRRGQTDVFRACANVAHAVRVHDTISSVGNSTETKSKTLPAQALVVLAAEAIVGNPTGPLDTEGSRSTLAVHLTGISGGDFAKSIVSAGSACTIGILKAFRTIRDQANAIVGTSVAPAIAVLFAWATIGRHANGVEAEITPTLSPIRVFARGTKGKQTDPGVFLRAHTTGTIGVIRARIAIRHKTEPVLRRRALTTHAITIC